MTNKIESKEANEVLAANSGLITKNKELLSELKAERLRRSELESELEALRADSAEQFKSVENMLINNQVAAFSAKHVIKGGEALIRPHLVRTLRVQKDEQGDYRVVCFNPEDEKELPYEDWEKLFTGCADFQSVIIGTRASGGGAPDPVIANTGLKPKSTEFGLK
ncbi:hypothetical protein [Sansalvadorimonas verongulae]|uniref:hypothetical protein n=1 Tax=Sansalvadorimonas verongulae TaxID=2172824 RepID=UPI0012BBD573|nr:hypothetical protein [Sansalvadorimonas verongulae]MTI13247.1 hypothetical protein [Sansalvadorimonas verongulae]